MRRYPRYKPTDLAWLPSVPEHWDVRKAKFLIRVGNGSDPKTDGDIPVYGSGAASFKTCGEYKEGPCVLVGRKGATLHIPHYVDDKYWNVDTAFDVKTISGDYSLRYYYYCATRFDYQYYIAQTTLPGMTKSDYLNMPLPVPPPSEQDRIVRYLDEKTAAIDELVRAKEREIDLLRERKQALVSAAVTGGAGAPGPRREGRAGQEGRAAPGTIGTPETSGPSVPEVPSVPNPSSPSRPSCPPSPDFRDSGVPWIGKIPKEWKVCRLKRLAKLKGGVGFPIEFQGHRKEAIPFIKVNALASRIDPSMDFDTISEETLEKLHATAFKKGSIVFAKVGAALLLRRFEFLPFDCCIDNNMMAIYDISQDRFWLRYAMSLLDFGFLVNPGAVPSVNQNQLGNLLLPVPPLPEQERIVEHLDGVCSELDAAEAAIRKQISLLQELRTRLVSDAVTGAVEV